METLDTQILSLTEQAATTAPELVLHRAGLTPDPFAADHPYDQLRAALYHTDLLSPSDILAQPLSDGDIARMTLLYLAKRDASCRIAIGVRLFCYDASNLNIRLPLCPVLS